MSFICGNLYSHTEKMEYRKPADCEMLCVTLKPDEYTQVQQAMNRLNNNHDYPMMSQMVSHPLLFPGEYPELLRILYIDDSSLSNRKLLEAYGTLITPLQLELDRVIYHLLKLRDVEAYRPTIYLLKNMKFFLVRISWSKPALDIIR